jgi:hypothetical protein
MKSYTVLGGQPAGDVGGALVAVGGHATVAHQPVPGVVAADDGEGADAVVVGLHAGHLAGQQRVADAVAVRDRGEHHGRAELHLQVAQRQVPRIAEGQPERGGHADALVDPALDQQGPVLRRQLSAAEGDAENAGEGGPHHQ